MSLKLTNEGEKPVVSLYGVIGDDWGGVTADQVRQTLNQIGTKPAIELRIHSEGGSYFEGVAIHSLLKSRKGPVNVVIDGLAASAASLVAMAGKTIEMAKHSWMMIHEARMGVYGTASELMNYSKQLGTINEQISDIYTARWSGSAEELQAAIAAETWFTAEEAITSGLADSVASHLAVAAHADFEKLGFKNVPKAVLKAKEQSLNKYRENWDRIESLIRKEAV